MAGKTVKVWARIGMSLEMPEDEFRKLAAGACRINEAGEICYGDIGVDGSLAGLFASKGEPDGDSYIPGSVAEEIAHGLDTLPYDMDVLPDPTITVEEMKEYGYGWDGMLPLNETAAIRLDAEGHSVFLLYEDGTEAESDGTADIRRHAARGGIFGIEKEGWRHILARKAARK